MSASNWTLLHPSTFFLMGIPGLQDVHSWISIPFCFTYIVALLGNCLLLVVVKIEPSLHEPMYLFLAMLAVADLVVTTAIVPKTLSVFWFEDGAIHLNGCILQMFVLHAVFTMESGFIMAMAFDRYMAICKPLRHSSVLRNDVVAKIGMAIFVRGIVLPSPFPFLLKWVSYCRGNIIFHTYCEFMGLVNLACVNVNAYWGYGLTAAFLSGGLDFILIALSYIQIMRAVFRLPSKESRAKAISTCSSHAGIILAFYIPSFFTFLTRGLPHSVSPCIQSIVANLYILVPPMVNPIIYGVRTKKIRESVLKIPRTAYPGE